MARKSRAADPKPPAKRTSSKPPGERVHPTEVVPLESLRPHPRNYKGHPEDQLAHIEASLRQHGYYKNVVVAREGTILAGHGVVEGAKRAGFKTAPVVRLPIDPDSPEALKIVALDNELPKFGETDDRALSELLKEIREKDKTGLLGTGYDDQRLAALVMVTRPESEIRTLDEAAEWVGMPEYDAAGDQQYKVVITFKSEQDRKAFVDKVGLRIDKHEKVAWSTRWPFTQREDAHSVRFESTPE